MMFKILVLHLPVRVRTQTGRYYNLSEEQTEYQIKDRLSFQKFLGLTLAKQRKKKEFAAKHELGVSPSEKQLNGLVLKKVEFLDVP